MTSTLDLSRYEPTPGKPDHYRLRQTASVPPAPQPGKVERKATEPNQTEREAAAVLLRLCDLSAVEYHGLTVALANGHQYVPDLWYPAARLAAEVKGEYSHFSRQRSRLAFDQARIEHPTITWIWMEKRKASKGKASHWRIEHYGAQLTQREGGR